MKKPSFLGRSRLSARAFIRVSAQKQNGDSLDSFLVAFLSQMIGQLPQKREIGTGPHNLRESACGLLHVLPQRTQVGQHNRRTPTDRGEAMNEHAAPSGSDGMDKPTRILQTLTVAWIGIVEAQGEVSESIGKIVGQLKGTIDNMRDAMRLELGQITGVFTIAQEQAVEDFCHPITLSPWEEPRDGSWDGRLGVNRCEFTISIYQDPEF
jgi:hypothetical protein